MDDQNANGLAVNAACGDAHRGIDAHCASRGSGDGLRNEPREHIEGVESVGAAEQPAPSQNARGRWSSDATFLLAAIGSAIGFGNVWRFPMLAYTHGGGAFMLPYLTALILAAIPMVVLEFALGQLFQVGHVKLISKLAPRAAGFGWSAVLGTFLIAQFYIILLAYVLVYLGSCFEDPLPWGTTQAEAHSFFIRNVLDASPSIEATGGVVPHVALCYMAIWAIVLAGVCNGATSIGWLVKLLMPLPFMCAARQGLTHYSSISTFPFLMVFGLLSSYTLIAFLIRGCSLPGAGAGVAELFRPDFRALFDLEIWAAAVSQLFFGVSVGLGTLTTYASYNPRHHPVVAAAVTVSLANSAFSLLSGITVFAFLGYLSELQGVPVPQLVASGPALAFEVFPVAIGLMPLPNLWAVLFFVMLLNLGLSSAVSMTAPLSFSISELIEERKSSALAAAAASFTATSTVTASTANTAASTANTAATATISAVSFIPAATADTAAPFPPCASTPTPAAASQPSSRFRALFRLVWRQASRVSAQARVAAALHLLGALSGLIYTTRAGIYWLELADHFVPMLLTLSVGVGQCIIVSRYYGATRLFAQLPAADQKFAAFWVFLWRFFLPIVLSILLASQIITEIVHPYDGFPAWALTVGWLLSLGPLALLPLVRLHQLWSSRNRPGWNKQHFSVKSPIREHGESSSVQHSHLPPGQPDLAPNGRLAGNGQHARVARSGQVVEMGVTDHALSSGTPRTFRHQEVWSFV